MDDDVDSISVSLGAPPERIAVVRALRGLGDMLCVVPALRSLRAAFPDAKVTLVGLPWAASFLERYPTYVDDLLEFPGYPGIPERLHDPVRLAQFVLEVQGSFDLALQLHGSGTHSNAFTTLLGARITAGYYLPALWCPDDRWFRPYQAHTHEVERWLELVEFLGLPRQGNYLEYPERAEDVERLQEAWPGWSEGPFVCLHPGAFEPLRRWPLERFAAAGDVLAQAGFTVVLTGSGGEGDLTRGLAMQMKAPTVDLAGRTELGGLAALLRRTSLLVCNDTGVSHLAAAVGAPSVVIFMASDPERWAPLDSSLHRAAGVPMPDRSNACLHTPEIVGHRCLRDACNSLALDPATDWGPAGVDEVLRHSFELLEAGPTRAGATS